MYPSVCLRSVYRGGFKSKRRRRLGQRGLSKLAELRMFFFAGIGGSAGGAAVQPSHAGIDANAGDVRGSSHGIVRRGSLR